MKSEFYNVALDRIRYSLVWEDNRTLTEGLQILPTDNLLIITSAGCNVLNALLQNPARLTAIDLNPVQNKLLEFKMFLIRHFDFKTFRALLGLDGPQSVTRTWQKLAPVLPDALQAYWSSFFESHPEGLLLSGKLENYLTGFYHTLPADQQTNLRRLPAFDTVEEQYAFYRESLHASAFRQRFITYFDEANLSKGRNPKLYKYAQEPGGEAFYNRLVKQLSQTLVKENFFFRFFFFGVENLPEHILPPCYREHNFETLKQQLPKVNLATGEAVDYLLSPAGAEITKASLSNIFEYTSEGEFRAVCKKLYAAGNRDLKIIFWNLLQDQGISGPEDSWEAGLFTEPDALKEACFYFRNVRLLAPSPVLQKVHIR